MAFRSKETQSAGKIVVGELSEILPIKHSQFWPWLTCKIFDLKICQTIRA